MDKCVAKPAAAVARKRGERSPWDSAPEDLNRYLPGEDYRQKDARVKAWTNAHRAELDAWYAAKKAVETEFGVEVGSHCSGDYSMPYLFPVGGKVRASRGNPVEIDPTALVVKPEWDALLDRFLAEFGIEKPHDRPRWWLVSYWG